MHISNQFDGTEKKLLGIKLNPKNLNSLVLEDKHLIWKGNAAKCFPATSATNATEMEDMEKMGLNWFKKKHSMEA